MYRSRSLARGITARQDRLSDFVEQRFLLARLLSRLRFFHPQRIVAVSLPQVEGVNAKRIEILTYDSERLSVRESRACHQYMYIAQKRIVKKICPVL
jgi:hypothetical protein